MFSRNKAKSYIDKWNKIAQSTSPIDKNKATKLLTSYLGSGKIPMIKTPPKRFVFVPSPLAWESDKDYMSMNIDFNFSVKPLGIFEKIFLSETQKPDFFEKKPYSFSGVYTQILEGLKYVQFYHRKKFPYDSNYIDNESNKDGLYKLIHLGNFNCYFNSILDYIFTEEIIKDKETVEFWNLFKQICEELHLFCIFEDTVYISEKPVKFHVNQKGKLHKDLAPAIAYSDGAALYFLNGVKVPEKLAITQRKMIDLKFFLDENDAEVRKEIVKKMGRENIDEKMILDEKNSQVRDQIFKKIGIEKLNGKLALEAKNAEIRKEIITMIGIEKVINDCGAEIVETSTDGMYQLLRLEVPNSIFSTRYYLKMRNPSVPVYHIEGVAPDCDTIQKALNFRAGGVELNPQFMA